MKDSNVKTSMVLIDSLEISQLTKNILKFNKIYYLEQLLELEYDEVKSIRGIGDKLVVELRDYLHKYGYSLKNEYISVDEKRKMYHQEGFLILEDLGFSSYIYYALYRNNIYTLEDLLKYGPDVFNIDNFGLKRKKELKLKMKDLGLSFDLNLEEQVDMLNKYSQIYKKNVRTQEELNRLYQSLLLKKQSLIEENAKLDGIIDDLKKKKGKVLNK